MLLYMPCVLLAWLEPHRFAAVHSPKLCCAPSPTMPPRLQSCYFSLFFLVQVGPHILGAVHSPKLAEALFDLYLGDQPVSKTAKDAAAQTLNRIAASSSSSKGATHDPYYLPQGKSEEIKCEGQAVEGSRRKGSLKSSKGGLGLGLSDLAACVLHMD